MKSLAETHVNIMHSAANRRFVSRVDEWNEIYNDLTPSAIVLWADTENALTTAYFSANALQGHVAEIDTAFTVLKKHPGDRNAEQFNTIADECERIVYEILRRMELDTDPQNPNRCANLFHHINLSTVRISRDGPYTNEYYGVTATLNVKVRNAIPAYDRDQWAS